MPILALAILGQWVAKSVGIPFSPGVGGTDKMGISVELDLQVNGMYNERKARILQLTERNKLHKSQAAQTNMEEAPPPATATPTPSNKCKDKRLRLSGGPVTRNIRSLSDGRICIGNSVSPSPNLNFLVFDKINNDLHFLGTESRNGSFIDFRPYVTWSITKTNPCDLLEQDPTIVGCHNVPPHLRGVLRQGAPKVECSREKPMGDVQFFCGNNGVVDDDGSLTIMSVKGQTLWY
ncbi:hypothetical protein BV898_01306 [Hypsibius exemplaris]|uniref:Uncharacterized protein n=1 Tax=Hypsibius exemplaris TaxID=2072580 RepID=A0A1W0XBB1_HYPEX|nr:hypothetical protein BV898_01306 [Hypsibius exemplaris]